MKKEDMKPIVEVYPQEERDYWDAPYDYDSLLESIGNIVVQVDDDDYQGDSRVLFRDGQRLGLLIFGWGSCSGCDALQACGNLKDVDKLRSELFDSIQWFENAAEAISYFETKDWSKDFHYHGNETKEFVDNVIDYLRINKELQ